MNVPRPLLVVVVVLIILGVVSCGAGVIRGRIDAAGPSPTPAVQFSGFGNEAIPPGELTFEALTGSCTPSGDPITVNGTCKTTIDPRPLRPRELRLRVGVAPALVAVSQHIRGEDQTTSDTIGTGDLVEVSVGGTSPITVVFACSCTLTFVSG